MELEHEKRAFEMYGKGQNIQSVTTNEQRQIVIGITLYWFLSRVSLVGKTKS
jgi:hypothetical protein